MLDAVLENLPAGVLIADSEGRIVRDNLASRELWGVPPETSSWKGYGDWVGWWPDTGERIKAEEWAMTRALLRGEITRNELVHNQKFNSDERRYYLNNVAPLRDAEGRIRGGVVAMIDVTDRIVGENALRKSEARLSAALQIARLGIWEYDPVAGGTRFDERCCQIYGIDKDRLVSNEEILEIIHVEDRARVEAHVRSALDPQGKGVYEAEYRIRMPDGKMRWISVRGNAIMSRKGDEDRIERFIGTAMDITERKESERILRESERKLAAELADMQLLQNISSELILQDRSEGLFEKILEAAQAIMGADFATLQKFYPERGEKGELLMTASRGFDEKADNYWEWVRADWNTTCGIALRTRERVIIPDMEKSASATGSKEQRLLLEDGIRAGQTTPLFSRAGELLGMISTHWRKPHEPSKRDLSLLDILARQAADLMEKKIIEESLRRAHDELEKRVQERTAELDLSNMALKKYAARLIQLNKELEEFTWITAHDLQEPLRKIQTFGNRLLDLKNTIDPKAREDLERIIKSAHRMSSLILSVKNYSDITKRRFSFEATDLSVLVEEAVSDLEIVIQNKDARVEVSGLPTIEIDKTVIRQVFQNLIANSIKYSKGHERPLIKITGEILDGACRIYLEDNGIGFEAQYSDYIFKPFKRLHGKSSRYDGTGMGLAICRKVVEIHGGNIAVESTPGIGSRFIITLPLEQSARPEPIGTDDMLEVTKIEVLQEFYRMSEKLREPEEIISAIRNGEIDALVCCEPDGEKVYILREAEPKEKTELRFKRAG
jgi:PAS domain S-box-containing protein